MKRVSARNDCTCSPVCFFLHATRRRLLCCYDVCDKTPLRRSVVLYICTHLCFFIVNVIKTIWTLYDSGNFVSIVNRKQDNDVVGKWCALNGNECLYDKHIFFPKNYLNCDSMVLNEDFDIWAQIHINSNYFDCLISLSFVDLCALRETIQIMVQSNWHSNLFSGFCYSPSFRTRFAAMTASGPFY